MKTWRGMSLGLLLAGGLLAQGAWAGEWIADAKGCKVWSDYPLKKGTTISLWPGNCDKGIASGEGSLQWFENGVPDGKYEGKIVDGKFDGKGVFYFPSGGRYEGDFVKGKRTGKGVYVFESGSRYEGDFVDGYFHGKGVFTSKDGDRYEGNFIKDKKTGKGIYTFASGSHYEGDFVDGEFHGKGIYTWKNGGRYEGDFVKGKFTGKGIFVSTNGNRYEGDFVDEIFHGKGIFTWKDGNRYEGDFVNGKRTGKGIYTAVSGMRYEGNFVDGRFAGNGTSTWKNGITYTGEFIDGKRTGFGTLRVPHGAYVGKERSNKGKWKMEEGFSYFEERGIFKNNAFIMACENKNACEDMVREPYRAEFRNAASSSELNGFIEKYKDNDPDGLVPQARKKIPAAQKYEREQERLAAIKRAKEEREAYRTAFKNASSSSDLSAFVERYKNNDPEKLVPKARQKISAAQKRERDQSAKQEREYAARLAQECGRLYPGKLVSWTAKMCEGRVLGLFGGGCYDEKFQGIIVGGGKGIATAKITKPSHKSGEYSERSCSDFN